MIGIQENQGRKKLRGKTKRTRKERLVPLRDLPQSREDALRAQREKERERQEK